MTDQALIAERDDWKRRAEANHAACEVMKRQLEEMEARLRELEQERDNADRLAQVYFIEAKSYRLRLEQVERQRCEGYIWGEPA